MNIYDKATISGQNGESDKFGQIVQITQTTRMAPNADFSGVVTETTTKVAVLTIPDMKVILVDSDRITLNSVKLVENDESDVSVKPARNTRKAA